MRKIITAERIMAGLGLVFFVLMVWWLTVLGKTATYKLFYEGQVRATVTEVLDERQGRE